MDHSFKGGALIYALSHYEKDIKDHQCVSELVQCDFNCVFSSTTV